MELRSDNAVIRTGNPAHAASASHQLAFFGRTRRLPGAESEAAISPCKTGKKWRKIPNTRGASHGLLSGKISPISPVSPIEGVGPQSGGVAGRRSGRRWFACPCAGLVGWVEVGHV